MSLIIKRVPGMTAFGWKPIHCISAMKSYFLVFCRYKWSAGTPQIAPMRRRRTLKTGGADSQKNRRKWASPPAQRRVRKYQNLAARPPLDKNDIYKIFWTIKYLCCLFAVLCNHLDINKIFIVDQMNQNSIHIQILQNLIRLFMQ